MGKEDIASKEKIDMESMEEMGNDLVIGNSAIRVVLFHLEE
jgi:hypothetical protein